MTVEYFRRNAEYAGRWPREEVFSPSVCWYYLDGNLLIDIGAPQGSAPKADLHGLRPMVRHIFVEQGLNFLKNAPFKVFSNLESVTLSEKLEHINWHDFESCTALKRVTLPQKLTAIPSYAFYNCAALEEVNIPDSVTVFGSFAFSGCRSLKNLHIPARLKEINQFALSGCAAFEQGLLNFDHCPDLVSIPTPGRNLPDDDSYEGDDDDYYFFGDAWLDLTEE